MMGTPDGEKPNERCGPEDEMKIMKIAQDAETLVF